MEVVSLEYLFLYQSKAARAKIHPSSIQFLFIFYLLPAVSFGLIRICHSSKQKDYLLLAFYMVFTLLWSQIYFQALVSKLEFLFFFLGIFMLMYFLVTLQECFVMKS